MTKAFLEIGGLFEDNWTGIGTVIASVAARALDDPSIDWNFCYETLRIPRDRIRELIDQRSGLGSIGLLASRAWEAPVISPTEAADAVGIYPNIKPMHRFFGHEASIIYDLSPILTPEFHSAANIGHFANRIKSDMESSDHVFCISQATLSDVQAYFRLPDDKVSIIQMGAAFDPADISAGLASLWGGTAEPYVAIVGTLEPRKNGALIFEYLAQNPSFASRYRIVFIGRDGWLEEKERLLALLGQSGVDPSRVTFTGYVSDAEKLALMLNSAFCVYPSRFEGYGLPVLEASALGKVTVCSNSSSLPEVAPEASIFFDPLDVFDLAQAMRIAELRASQTRSSDQALEEIMRRVAPLSWDRAYQPIAEWVRTRA
jgi:glycosyltransferase involved in cell wall biosynthesis